MLLLLTISGASARGDVFDLPGESFGPAEAKLETALEELGLKQAVADGRLGIALVTMDGLEAKSLAMANGNQMMYAASLPKIAILYGAAVAIDEGRFEPDEAQSADMVAMIRRSCNACATRVLEAIGREWLLELLQAEPYRFYDYDKGGGLWVGKDYARDGAFRRDPLQGLSHAATPWQVARWYYLLINGRLASREQTELMLEVLSDPAISHKFVGGLEGRPTDELYRKSGTWMQYHSDSMLLTAGSASFILVAMANDASGGQWLEKIAARVYDRLVSEQ